MTKRWWFGNHDVMFSGHLVGPQNSPLPKTPKGIILGDDCNQCLIFSFWYHFIANTVYFHNLSVAKLANLPQHLKFHFI